MNTIRKLFLIDGCGALLSFAMLGIVFMKFNELLGIPRPTLQVLALPPLVFALYDFYCLYRWNSSAVPFRLGIIAVSNLLYCVLSAVMTFNHRESVTLIGWIYFTSEILIVIVLVVAEFTATKWDK